LHKLHRRRPNDSNSTHCSRHCQLQQLKTVTVSPNAVQACTCAELAANLAGAAHVTATHNTCLMSDMRPTCTAQAGCI
jgi:hypothetical protein